MVNQAQEFRIKQMLARLYGPDGRRLTMASLARLLDLPYGSVAGVVYGYRKTPRVRAEIAAFLGMTVAELFGGDSAHLNELDTGTEVAVVQT